MSENIDETREAAREAVSGDNIRDQVKNITLAALSQRQLDKESIKQVIHSVVEGVSEGVGDSAERVKPQLKESLAGIDDALAKSAMAAKLAVEEAAGRAESFAKEDLKSAVSQLESLEDLFIDTVNTVAKQTGELTSSALTELSAHLKNTGTASGREALDAVSNLKNTLLDVGKDSVSEITNATSNAASQLAQVASGLLSGMAEAIQPNRKDSDNKS